MTLGEIKKIYPNKRLVALSDPSNGLTLMAGGDVIEWPEDWPETVTRALLEDSGFEVLRGAFK